MEEDWINCPYNSNHRMPPSRFQWHLVKCPDKKRVGENFTACPYNAQHIILKTELENHKRKCPDKTQRDFAETDSALEIDKKIKEYLGSQTCSADWSTSKNSWMPAPSVPVGSATESQIQFKPKKSQKKNAARRKNQTNSTPITARNSNESVSILKDVPTYHLIMDSHISGENSIPTSSKENTNEPRKPAAYRPPMQLIKSNDRTSHPPK